MGPLLSTRIFRRQFLTLFGLTLVFFGTASLALLFRTERAIVDRQIEVSAAYRDQIGTHLLDWIEERKGDIIFVAHSGEREGEEVLQSAYAHSLLTLFISTEPFFSQALVVGRDGHIIADKAGAGPKDLSISDRDYVREALAGRVFSSGYFRGRRSGAASFAVSAPLVIGGEVRAAVVGILHIEEMVRIVDQVSLRDMGVAYLVDREGHVVSAPEFARRFRELGPELAGPRVDSLAIRAVTAGRDGSSDYRSIDGKWVVGAYRWIAPIGLGLVVELSRDRALAPITALFQFFILLTLGLLIALLVVAAYLSARLIAPIGALIDGAEKIIRDKFHAPIDMHTGTELDQLVEMFNRMAATVRGRENVLRESASRDSLTGLYNHGRIEEFLELEIKRRRRSGEPLSFVMLDVDHFKSVNDKYGHQAGDEVLRRVADILEETVRGGDIVGRYGGEEFAVILDAKSGEEVAAFCERLRRRVEEAEAVVGGQIIKVTASLGWTRVDAEESQHFEVISRADRALYDAKNAGRNRVVGVVAEAPPLAPS